MTEPTFDANGWATIDSAPKDYTEVMLYDPHAKVLMGYHRPLSSMWMTIAGDKISPTHWKPLGPGPVGT